jgi:dCMP deaminase
MQAGVPSWDEYFLEICRTVSKRSKDPNTKLGAVIVGPAHEIRATGYNSLVRGVKDDVAERLVRPQKYLWMEHAERNAIYNAARHGVQLEGCSLFVELLPCMDCARGIVQAGIKEVVVDGERARQYWSAEYTPHFTHMRAMFAEAGVALRFVPPIETGEFPSAAPTPA